MTKEELNSILTFAKNAKVSEISAAKIFGFNCKAGLSYFKKKYGIKIENIKHNFSKDDIINVLNYASNNRISEQEAAKEILGINSISQYKKKYSIVTEKTSANQTGKKIRKYDVNDNFFETPNIVNCYYAGFIAADGCICGNMLRMCVSEKDKEWLENFKKDIESDSPIKVSTQKGLFNMCSISITSKKMCDDLNKNFSITPRKSLTLSPPNLKDEELIYAFICGYIDGDGSIFLSDSRTKNPEKSNKILHISILGTEKMCEWIKGVFSSITGGKGSLKRKPKTKIYRLDFCNKSAREIVKRTYILNIPKLSRKWTSDVIKHSVHFKKKHFDLNKHVNVFDLYGNFVSGFNSQKDAAKFVGTSPDMVSKCCIGGNKCQTNGFMFSVNDEMKKYCPPPKSTRWVKIKETLVKTGKIKDQNDF